MASNVASIGASTSHSSMKTYSACTWDGQRRTRRVALLLELASDDRELQQVQKASLCDPPVAGEPRKGLDQHFLSQGRAHLEARLHRAAADQSVRSPGRDHDRVPVSEQPLAPGESQLQLPRDDLVELRLPGVEVLLREEALGLAGS